MSVKGADLVVRGHRMIELERLLVGAVLERRGCGVLVATTIGQREILRQVVADFVAAVFWNDVAWERLPGERIGDRDPALRKIAFAFKLGRHVERLAQKCLHSITFKR